MYSHIDSAPMASASCQKGRTPLADHQAIDDQRVKQEQDQI